MQLVLLTALGVGLSTVVGAALGFVINRIAARLYNIILGFAAGIMMAASILGLILPALDKGTFLNLVLVILGIFCGAIFLVGIDHLSPTLARLSGLHKQAEESHAKINKVMLFVIAIAIHNIPEGLAAGVAFGGESIKNAMTVAIGIMLQNLPDGMVIIGPLLSVGISKKRTFLLAASTGLIEVVCTLLGYLTVSVTSALLPFALAFAGGTMLYVVNDEMIPEIHQHGYKHIATYSLLGGFCLMLIVNFLT